MIKFILNLKMFFSVSIDYINFRLGLTDNSVGRDTIHRMSELPFAFYYSAL